jgi:hypothetical protein
MEKIIFTDVVNPDGVLAKPKPATEYIPDWFKNAKPYLTPDGKRRPMMEGEHSHKVAASIKKCMPLWDMMTAGYIIETHCDIYIHQREGIPHYQWAGIETIAFQPEDQLQSHPAFPIGRYGVRLQHPWSIKTPKGWSILIMQPTHREQTPMQILPGIVDTDDYQRPFNMFFILSDPNFEGMIPAGTPFAQVIPFKREAWVSELGGEKERNKAQSDTIKMLTVIFDRYKKFWWKRKEYK